MHFLVVGRGWTGKKVFKELLRRGHVVTFCSHNDAIQTIENNKFDWVVNCAGKTGSPNVDACELDKQGTIEANAIFPALLADACEKTWGTRLAHFSSGCIDGFHIERKIKSACDRRQCAQIRLCDVQAHYGRFFSVTLVYDNAASGRGLDGLGLHAPWVFAK